MPVDNKLTPTAVPFFNETARTSAPGAPANPTTTRPETHSRALGRSKDDSYTSSYDVHQGRASSPTPSTGLGAGLHRVHSEPNLRALEARGPRAAAVPDRPPTPNDPWFPVWYAGMEYGLDHGMRDTDYPQFWTDFRSWATERGIDPSSLQGNEQTAFDEFQAYRQRR